MQDESGSTATISLAFSEGRVLAKNHRQQRLPITTGVPPTPDMDRSRTGKKKDRFLPGTGPSASSGLPDRLAYLAEIPFKRLGCLPIV
jgi:hypothetical protein